MELGPTCELLKACQSGVGDNFKAAEQQLLKAIADKPNELVLALCNVLATAGVDSEIRQQAAIYLRQLVSEDRWNDLHESTRKTLQATLLSSLEHVQSSVEKTSIGHIVAQIGREAEDFDNLQEIWPELLATLSRLVTSNDPDMRVVTLGILRDLADLVAAGLLDKGGKETLGSTLVHNSPKVQAAGAQCLLGFIGALYTEEAAPLGEIMPAFINVLQGFATNKQETELEETLKALNSCIEVDESADFFKEYSFQALWDTLATLCLYGSSESEVTIAEGYVEQVRNSAMQCLVSMITELSDEFAKPAAKSYLEQIVTLNIRWMLEVEEDVMLWTEEGKMDDEDEVDGACAGYALENLDTLGDNLALDAFMPVVFKVIQALPKNDWKQARACVLAIFQTVEYSIDDDDETEWADRCFEFIEGYFTHEHPRVRYAAYAAIAHGMGIEETVISHVVEKYKERLLPAIIKGMKDDNIRVATVAVQAMSASTQPGLEFEDIEEHMDVLLTELFRRLDQKESKCLQEECLSCIASVAEIAAEEFQPYYPHVMPLLKSLISQCSGEDAKELRGKCFECVAEIGEAVGKEIFAADACEVMGAIIKVIDAGFSSEDTSRESIYEASARIAEVLEKDFAPFVPALLPSMFRILGQRPAELTGDDRWNEEEFAIKEVGNKTFGLKTSTVDEMTQVLDMLAAFIQHLEEAYCEYMAPTCTNLVPLLDFQNDDLRKKAFKVWETLVECAKESANKGKIDKSILQQVVQEFLKHTVAGMSQADVSKMDLETCSTLSGQASGVTAVVSKAGQGVLAKEVVRDVGSVHMKLLMNIKCDNDANAGKAGRHKKKTPPTEMDDDYDDDEEEEEEQDEVTPQSVRFALVDVLCAMMRTNRDEFVELGLSALMEFVREKIKAESNECDRCLAFYIAASTIEALGDATVPYWNWFLNQALAAVVDKSWAVRQFATASVSNASVHQAFSPMAAAAASQIYNVLEKHGERHRRRRQRDSDKMQAAFALEECIRALGLITEHHEQSLGAHAGKAWSMWLKNLPLKYDQETGQKVHAQLVSLLGRSHPALAGPAETKMVLEILVNVWNTKFSNKDVDKQIVTGIGEANLEGLKTSVPENKQKKVEQMVKAAKRAAGGA